MIGLRLLIATALLSACSVAPARSTPVQGSGQTASSATTALRSAIVVASAPARVAVVERSAAEVRRIVGANVDPALLKGVVAVGGNDLRFTSADDRPRHAGVLVLRYPTAALATLRLGTRKAGFFRDTKILTPMTIARSGTTIAIFFTESGGDPAMRALLSDAARRLI